MKLAVVGGSGRVGANIVLHCLNTKNLAAKLIPVRDRSTFFQTPVFIAARLNQHNTTTIDNALIDIKDLRRSDEQVDVVIDFSHPDALKEAIIWSQIQSFPLLVGTTALESENIKALEILSRTVPVMIAANTSLVLHRWVKQVVELAGELDDLKQLQNITIDEIHRTGKRDMPSGTALMIAAALKDQVDIEPTIISHREDDAVASHHISFQLSAEQLKYSHIAEDRSCFAQGAIVLAQWLVNQKPGIYAVQDYIVNMQE